MSEELVSSFFKKIVSKTGETERFLEDLYFLGVKEWHLSPQEIDMIEIPLLLSLLKKQQELVKALNKKGR